MQISLRTSRTWCELGKQNILANRVYSSLFAVKKRSQGMNCSCHVRFSFLYIIGVKRHGGIWVSYCQVWKKFQCYCDWLLQIGNLQEMCQRLTIVKSSIKSWPMLAYSSDLEGAGSEAMLLGRMKDEVDEVAVRLHSPAQHDWAPLKVGLTTTDMISSH